MGSGKSFCGLTIGCALDKKFNIDRIVFKASDFMELIRAKLEPGSFIIADEIGSWFGSRDYMTRVNKDLSAIIQTFRHQRLGVIFTLPHLRQVDINVRDMGDVSIETLKIHKKLQMVEAKFKEIEINPLTGNKFMKFPVVTKENGKVVINPLFIDRPPKELEKMYLEKKEEHMEDQNTRIHHKAMKEDGVDEDVDDRKTVKCKKCGYMWKTAAMKPRCSRCESSIVVAVN